MFKSIPWDHDYEIKVYAKIWDGKETELNFVLPGLTEDNGHERIHKLYSSFCKKNYAVYLDAYLEALRPAIEEAMPEATGYRVELISHRMWGLKKIRQKGEISRPIITEYGPFEVY